MSIWQRYAELWIALLFAIVATVLWGFAEKVYPPIRASFIKMLATWRFRRSYGTARTCLVLSRSERANWDQEAKLRCRTKLRETGSDPTELLVDTVQELWNELGTEKAVNLILLGSPLRLPLASKFLEYLGETCSLPASVFFAKSLGIGAPPHIRLLTGMEGQYPTPHAPPSVHPVQITAKGRSQTLIWPGIGINANKQESLFPKYPCEGDLRPAIFRGYEHGVVLVLNGTPLLPGQRQELTIKRLVMLMGYSGPSTLASVAAYLSRPDLFEPTHGGVLLSIVEAPVVCDQSSPDQDLRFVPADSVRIIARMPHRKVPLLTPNLPFSFAHPELRLSADNQPAK